MYLQVLIGMKRFPQDEIVQKNACFLLKSCAFSTTNLALMCQYSDQLLPLLLQASDAFPEQCRSRATKIAQKMERYQGSSQ